jgi:hypothetical protein
LFPVLSETGAETGDDPLHSPASVGDRCRPGRLTLRAGGEPFDLVLAKTDGCVETSGFGGNVVQPAPAGVGVAPGPGGGLFGPRPPGPPVGSVLGFLPGSSQARLGSSQVENGLTGAGAEVGAPPGAKVTPGLLGLTEGGPSVGQLGRQVERLQLRGGVGSRPASCEGQSDDPGLVPVGQREDGFPDAYCRQAGVQGPGGRASN